jgi:hypothetical protein
VLTLAGEIAAAAGSARSILLGAKNLSSLDGVRAAALRDAFEFALRAKGLGVAPVPPADAEVQLTLSEGVNGCLLVAEIHQGDMQQVEMIALPKPYGSAVKLAPQMVLQRRIVWRQAAPILDFARAGDDPSNSTLFLLEPDRLVALKSSGKTQQSQETAPITGFPATRDLRGQIISADSSHVMAYVEGVTCIGAWNPAFQVTCGANAPLPGARSLIARQNYFAGGITSRLGPPATVPAYYSAAFSPAVGSAGAAGAIILAEIDGSARLYEKSTDHSLRSSAVFSGWGDNIASVTAGCDAEWHILVTGASDWTEPDHIQLYEIADQQAVAVGQPLEFPGPIVALWPAINRTSVRVVSRDLQSGMYEASIVSVSCGN